MVARGSTRTQGQDVTSTLVRVVAARPQMVGAYSNDAHTVLVMEFAEGEPLDELVFEGRDGRLPPHVARYLFRQVRPPS